MGYVFWNSHNLSGLGVDENIENWLVFLIGICHCVPYEQALRLYERGYGNADRHYRKWTDEDCYYVMWGRANGLSNGEIAKVLNRRPDNVSHYYGRLKGTKYDCFRTEEGTGKNHKSRGRRSNRSKQCKECG